MMMGKLTYSGFDVRDYAQCLRELHGVLVAFCLRLNFWHRQLAQVLWF